MSRFSDSSPDSATPEFLLASGFDHFSWADGWPDAFKLLLGRSLFIQEGAEHRRNRRLIMPVFHGGALARYFKTMETISQRYFKQWEAKQAFIWYDEFKQLTFAIASEIFLSTPPGSDIQRLSQLFTTLTNGLFGLVNLPGSLLSRAIAARDQLREYLTQVIHQRQMTPTDDALSLLIQATDGGGDRLSLEEIRDQAMLLLLAGHETTTSMLTWFCLELARHPTVWQRARTEQQAHSTAVSLEQRGKMPHLDQIFSEIERLHPPVGGGFAA